MRPLYTPPEISNQRFKHWLAEQEVSVNSGFFQRRANEFCRYFYFCPRQAKKQTILFIHATGNDALFPNLDYFSLFLSAGWQLFCFDLDGHGQASNTLLQEDDIWSAVESGLRELDKHCKQESEVHLLGESIGGLLAWVAACTSPKLAKSAICIAAPFSLQLSSQALLNECRSITGMALREYRHRWGLLDSIPALGPLLRSRYPIRIAPKKPFALINSFSYPLLVSSLLKSEAFQASQTPQIPVYAFFGELDKIAPIEGMPAYFQQNQSQWHLTPSSTHFDMLLGGPNAQALKSLIRRLESSNKLA